MAFKISKTRTFKMKAEKSKLMLCMKEVTQIKIRRLSQLPTLRKARARKRRKELLLQKVSARKAKLSLTVKMMMI